MLEGERLGRRPCHRMNGLFPRTAWSSRWRPRPRAPGAASEPRVAVLRSIDGVRDVREIVEAAGLHRGQVVGALFELGQAGFLEKIDPQKRLRVQGPRAFSSFSLLGPDGRTPRPSSSRRSSGTNGRRLHASAAACSGSSCEPWATSGPRPWAWPSGRPRTRRASAAHRCSRSSGSARAKTCSCGPWREPTGSRSPSRRGGEPARGPGPVACGGRAAAPPAEIAGLWVVRTGLLCPRSWTRSWTGPPAGGFNALFVQVRGRGDAFYASRVVERSELLRGQPADFDPLARLLARARARGLAGPRLGQRPARPRTSACPCPGPRRACAIRTG